MHPEQAVMRGVIAVMLNLFQHLLRIESRFDAGGPETSSG